LIGSKNALKNILAEYITKVNTFLKKIPRFNEKNPPHFAFFDIFENIFLTYKYFVDLSI